MHSLTKTRPAFRALLLSLLLGGCAIPGDSSGDSTAEDSDLGSDDPGTRPGGDGNGTYAPAWCPASGGGNSIKATRPRGTTVGGNSTGVHGCRTAAGYEYNHYEEARGGVGRTQLHVVGIYEPAPEGSVEVRVKRQGASVLVLSAYDATRWNVVIEPGAVVQKILVSGYHEQSVDAPPGIPVEVRSYDQTFSYLGFGHAWPSHKTTDLVDTAEGLTGLELTSFRGCYASNRFDIDEPGDVKPGHEVSLRPEPTLPAGCESLAGDAVQCVTLVENTPVFFGPDSGARCSGAPARVEDLHHASSLAWQGNYVYGCIHDRGIARVSLTDGSADIAPFDCEAVAEYEGGLMVMRGRMQGLAWFDSFEAAARRQASCLPGFTPYASRIAVHGTRGYFAWHSTHEVQTVDFARGGQLRTLRLDGYDGWIMGMDATSDGRLLILGPEAGIHVFDAATGAARGQLPLAKMGSLVNGLACWSGRP